VINQSTGASTDPVRRKQAILIAEAYMEEIQQAQFTVCDPADANAAIATDANAAAPVGCAASSTTEKLGPEAGNTRPYDNVNDYVPVGYTLGTPVRAFAVADASGKLVDRDVSGAALGVNAVGSALGSVDGRHHDDLDPEPGQWPGRHHHLHGAEYDRFADHHYGQLRSRRVRHAGWLSHPLPARRAMSLPSAARQHGFTLIETIVVMMITAILAGIMVLFIRRPVQNYVDNAARADMADVADRLAPHDARIARRAAEQRPLGGHWQYLLHRIHPDQKRRAIWLLTMVLIRRCITHWTLARPRRVPTSMSLAPCRPRLTRSRLATRS
jgi:prepilin-type N-terminal cleavage/methylation domain-containing protein